MVSKTPETDDIVVDAIEHVRKENNVLWMTILRIALKHAPDDTKDILKQIKQNDQRISKWVGRLAD